MQFVCIEIGPGTAGTVRHGVGCTGPLWRARGEGRHSSRRSRAVFKSVPAFLRILRHAGSGASESYAVRGPRQCGAQDLRAACLDPPLSSLSRRHGGRSASAASQRLWHRQAVGKARGADGTAERNPGRSVVRVIRVFVSGRCLRVGFAAGRSGFSHPPESRTACSLCHRRHQAE